MSEANELLANGFSIGTKQQPVNIHSFMLDASAHAFIKGIKRYSGWSSCEKCVGHKNHNLEPSPCRSLPVGLVTHFRLDCLHLACVGVVYRFLLNWKLYSSL